MVSVEGDNTNYLSMVDIAMTVMVLKLFITLFTFKFKKFSPSSHHHHHLTLCSPGRALTLV